MSLFIDDTPTKTIIDEMEEDFQEESNESTNEEEEQEQEEEEEEEEDPFNPNNLKNTDLPQYTG